MYSSEAMSRWLLPKRRGKNPTPDILVVAVAYTVFLSSVVAGNNWN